MPIILKEFTHTQTATHITLTIPIPNTSHADIYSTPLYMKINSPPYLFYLDFSHCVEISSANSTIHPHKVVSTFEKSESQIWETVSFTVARAGGREALTERRRQGDQLLLEHHEARKRTAKQEAVERDRELVRKQIKLEQRERAAVEREILDEKKSAQADLFENWGVNSDATKEEDIQDANTPEKANITSEKKRERLPELDFDDVELDNLDDSDLDMKAIMDKVSLQINDSSASEKADPPPRTFAEIQREKAKMVSTLATNALAKWHARIKEAKEAAAAASMTNAVAPAAESEESAISKSLKLKETLEKAKLFMSRKDHASAFNAYTSVITIDATHIQAYMNRAVCSLMQTDYPQAISDCTSALSLCDAESEAIFQGQQAGEGELDNETRQVHQQRKAKILVRRGSARVWSGKLKDGLADYREAYDIVGGEELKRDIDAIQERLR